MYGMSLPGLMGFPVDSALCWEMVKPGCRHPSWAWGAGAGARLVLLTCGLPSSTAAARQHWRRRRILLSGPDSVGETCESVHSIVSIFKSLPFLAGEAPLIVKSLQQMKQNKEEFNA